ncbi:Xaa-Pro dipeptidase [Hathewaya proteolytica DSM 3090]|uniref:Xaa-Pro dipeptidase n=1 Tax=Hathewaya proteolytica DSM 3090 TaxID=1121331 RepID=A0A1M6R4H1_9CLOT|nr:Xaa-Pro peptidase family protein [Hathewaya proteolytica]SHK27369.1 Xaa-Pro dipeptidase [Hathewaya proteolytica DSM 3090]
MFQAPYIENLYELMKKNNIDAVIIAPSNDLEYLLDFSPAADERFQALFLLQNGDYFYVTPELNYEEILHKLGKDAKYYIWSDGEGFVDCVAKALKEYGLDGKNIGVNCTVRAINMLDVAEKVSCKFFNAHNFLEQFRIIKSEEDIEKMRTAAKMADHVMEVLSTFIKPGMTEKDIKEKVYSIFDEQGADGISFEPIISSGPNSSMPHYSGDSRVIQEQDLVILDLGCKYKGYCSDTSRTFFIGDITDKQREVYGIVKKAHWEAEHFAKAGVTCGDVDKIARDIIKESGHGEHFLNRTGHGIGYSVHEAPYIKENNKLVLEPGMAFSIEPGIYIPGEFGMRIEDIVVIDKNGNPDILNQFSREIIIIK